MKAIGLLKYFKNKKGTTYKMMCKVNEAIEELEALENKSCERCKYSFDIFTGLDDSFFGEDFICTKLEVDKVFEKDFYCSKYEPKQ